VQGADVTVCCPGCRAAVQFIGALGLDDFYRFRTVVSPKPSDTVAAWSAYDDPVLLETLTSEGPQGRTVVLMIDGMTCAACSWLVSRSLQHIAGVRHVSVNTATGRAQIVWDSTHSKLSELLGVIAGLGYKPQIATAENDDARGQNERRGLLKRLAVAGLGMMQVMMFAVAMYAGDMQGMEADVRTYLRIVSLLVATPVMLYGGWPYFAGAARALAKRTITMDVPVALGLMLAYSASVFNTWRHAGEVYFDSVTMFIFFLTVARYVEMVARHHHPGERLAGPCFRHGRDCRRQPGRADYRRCHRRSSPATGCGRTGK
jgi:Cu2+-exporting ATPase